MQTVEQQALDKLFPYLDRLLVEYADLLNTDPEKRLIFFAFLFGGVSGLSMRLKMNPPQAHAVALVLFSTGLEMTAEQSARLAQHGIDATSSSSPYNAAVHAGLDEFFTWLADPDAFRPSRLTALLP